MKFRAVTKCDLIILHFRLLSLHECILCFRLRSEAKRRTEQVFFYAINKLINSELNISEIRRCEFYFSRKFIVLKHDDAKE